MGHRSRLLSVLLVGSSFLLKMQIGFAQELNTTKTNNPNDDLAQMSIEQLINLEVTSASKKPEKLSNVSSALFVLTNSDIRRSGATTLPDALRMVPGLTVAKVDGNNFTVSSRGFSDVYNSKLLVLIDGRSVYTPLFAGVFWNEQDVLLEDIDRIEVIRGPGATLYGANAVNGVINIITKQAHDTLGDYVSAGGGNQEGAFAEARHGGTIGSTDYRAYVKAFDNEESRLATGGHAHDDWKSVRSGFRTDTELSDRDSLTVQGDAFYSEGGVDALVNTLQGKVPQIETRYLHGANLLGNWERRYSEDSSINLKFYYDRIERDDAVLNERRDTFDLDFQHQFNLSENHNLMYGAEYRVYNDDIDSTFEVGTRQEHRTIGLYTAFIQDDITLAPNLWRLTLGSKLEYSDFSRAVEPMPNIRVAYTPTDSSTLWAAVSRAVRSPSRLEEDGKLVVDVRDGQGEGSPRQIFVSHGNADFHSEKLIAYELGYRTALAENLSFDAATFYNVYDDILSTEPAGAPFLNDSDPYAHGQSYIEVPYEPGNGLRGRSVGGEAFVDWRPIKEWRLIGSYSYIHIDLERKPGSQDMIYIHGEDQTPNSQFMIRSQVQLPWRMEFDTALRYVDSIPALKIDSYFELDARISRRWKSGLELSIVGQNLLHDEHPEYEATVTLNQRAEFPRAVYARASYRF